MSIQTLQRIELVDLKAQIDAMRGEIDDAIHQVLDTCAFIGGQQINQFEREFAQYIGAKHCIGVGNGTDALFISLKVLGIRPGDEVITVANSFIATSEAISATGAKVVFVDCDEDSYTIDVERVKAAITNRTKAIVPVHLYGQPAAMDHLNDLARKHGLFILEDAAQAHGAEFHGKRIGTLGDCASFSFYPGKNLGAIGDAGAILTYDDKLAERLRMFANHGRKSKYDHEFEGVNSRLDGLQAAVLRVKLKYLDECNERRREIAARYDAAFENACICPSERPGCRHVYHLYVVRVKQRDQVLNQLKERGVMAGVHYPISLPLLKAYQSMGHAAADSPVASRLQNEILSLPIHGHMSDEQVQYVIENFLDVLQLTQ